MFLAVCSFVCAWYRDPLDPVVRRELLEKEEREA